MVDRAGILRHSPLQLAVASIRFAPWRMFDGKIPEIQDALRDGFPFFHEVTQFLGPDTVQNIHKSWIFVSADRSTSIQMSADQVFVFCRKYSRYSNFAVTIGRALDVILGYMKFLDVINMGIRYVDLITKKPNEDFGQYVSEALFIQELGDLKPLGGFSMKMYEAGESELRVRSATQDGIPPIPDDLFPAFSVLQAPDAPTLAPLTSDDLMLDIDAVNVFKELKRMDKASVESALDQLHSLANGFFRHKNVCKDHAFSVWRGDQS